MAKDGPAPGRVTAGVETRDGTRLTGQIGATCYGLDQRPYLLPVIIDKLLTDLGKIEQTAEARM